MGSAIADFYNSITSNLAALSQKALAAFGALTGGGGEVISELDVMRNRVKALGEGIRALELSGVVAGSRLTKWFIDTAKASNVVEKEFLQQKIALEDLVEQFERGESQSRLMGYSVEDLERQFNLLDDQDLSRLAGAIDRVNAEVNGLKDSLEDTISSLRQELASLQGDNEQLEQLRYQEQRLELETQLQRARGLGDRAAIAAAQEALDLAQKAYNIRLAQAKQRTAEDKARVAKQAAEVERQRQLAEAQQRETTAQNFAQEDRQNPTAAPSRTIIIQAPDGQRASVTTDNEDDLISVLESLGRRVS
jgi:chromosome segregation ATPase